MTKARHREPLFDRRRFANGTTAGASPKSSVCTTRRREPRCSPRAGHSSPAQPQPCSQQQRTTSCLDFCDARRVGQIAVAKFLGGSARLPLSIACTAFRRPSPASMPKGKGFLTNYAPTPGRSTSRRADPDADKVGRRQQQLGHRRRPDIPTARPHRYLNQLAEVERVCIADKTYCSKACNRLKAQPALELLLT